MKVPGLRRKAFCGILGFEATPDICYVPNWLRSHLRIKEGERINITNMMMPDANYIRLKPLLQDFLFYRIMELCKVLVDDRLRYGLSKYACVAEENVLECKSVKVTKVVDTNITIDSGNPKDYAESLKARG